MIQITMKYIDEDDPRVIKIADSNISDEEQFVDWVLNSSWSDCNSEDEIKTEFYLENEWLCDTYFNMIYRGYSIFDWYSPKSGWRSDNKSYVKIEVI